MRETDKGGLVLEDSAEFNAALWAARADGNDTLADELLAQGIWTNTTEGTLSRRAELSVKQTEEILRLIGDVASGLVVVHPSHQQTARQMQAQWYSGLGILSLDV